MPYPAKASAPPAEKNGPGNSFVSPDPSVRASQCINGETSSDAPASEPVSNRVSSCAEFSGEVISYKFENSQLTQKVVAAIKRARRQRGRKRKSVQKVAPVLRRLIPEMFDTDWCSDAVADRLGVQRLGVLDVALGETRVEVKQLAASHQRSVEALNQWISELRKMREDLRKPAARAMGAGAGREGVT